MTTVWFAGTRHTAANISYYAHEHHSLLDRTVLSSAINTFSNNSAENNAEVALLTVRLL